MDDWKERFGLIEVRRIALNDTEHHRKTLEGTYLNLTREVVIDKAVYLGLPRWEQHLALAAAAGLTADRAVVSGVAAARLWGLGTRSLDPTVDLTLTDSKPRARKSWPPNTRYRSASLNPDQIAEKEGLRLTTMGRTVADIARWVGLIDAVIALDSVRQKFPDEPFEDLRMRALGPGPFHGRETVRRALELSRPGIDSPLESWARMLLIQANLGVEILTQVKIEDSEGDSYFVLDLLLDRWLAIEVDGEVKYDGSTFGNPTDEVIRAERQREKKLQNKGLVILRVGVRDLVSRSRGESNLVRQVRELIAARSTGLSA